MGAKVPQYPPTQQVCPDGSPNPNYVEGFVKPTPSPPPPLPSPFRVPAEVGTVFATTRLRAEVRIVGVDRVAFAVQGSPSWEWVVLREVKSQSDVLRLCDAIGISPDTSR